MNLEYPKKYNAKVDQVVAKTTVIGDKGIDLAASGAKVVNKYAQKGVGFLAKVAGDIVIGASEGAYRLSAGVASGVKNGIAVAKAAKAMNNIEVTPTPTTAPSAE